MLSTSSTTLSPIPVIAFVAFSDETKQLKVRLSPSVLDKASVVQNWLEASGQPRSLEYAISYALEELYESLVSRGEVEPNV